MGQGRGLMDLKSKKVALLLGGSSPESGVSRESAEAVKEVFKELGLNYKLYENDESLPSLLVKDKPDLAFLAVHGLYGEDGVLQSLLESLKIPYTGSGVLASAVCMDKIFFKSLIQSHKLPTPQFQVINEDKPRSPFSYPVILKSSHGGSSLGTYLVKKQEDLKEALKEAKKIGTPVFFEEYLGQAREVACSFLDGQILTPVEIEPKDEFYNFKTKYEKGQSSYFIPARLDSVL